MNMYIEELIDDMYDTIAYDLTAEDDVCGMIHDEIQRRTIYTNDCFDIIKHSNITTDYNDLPFGSNSIDDIARGILETEVFDTLYNKLYNYQLTLKDEDDEDDEDDEE